MNQSLIKPLSRFFTIGLFLINQSCATQEEKVLTQNTFPAPRKTIEVEGQAIIKDGAVLFAKKQALQDAIRAASMQSAVNVKSHTHVDQFQITTDSLSAHTAASVKNTRIVDESTENGVYHVKAMVDLSPDNTCHAQYRKRIVATAFPKMRQEQVSDFETNDLPSGIPRELGHLLTESADFFSINLTNVALYPRPDLAPDLQERSNVRVSKVMQVASETGTQLVLSGVIRDLEVVGNENMRGSGAFSMARNFARDLLPAERSVGIDIYVHDGLTGALLFQHRYAEIARGEVWIPATHSVGSEGFRSSATGDKITSIIEKAHDEIRQSLNCYPFAAKIIQVQGEKLVIDAGSQEKLAIGDQLIIYSGQSAQLGLDGGTHYFPMDKQPVGVVIIETVTPRYATGRLEATKQKPIIKVGDWVRSDF